MDSEKLQRYYLNTAYFKNTNPNPTSKGKCGWKWDKPDCVVRAVANAIGCEWLAAYDWLAGKARECFTVPNDGTMNRKWFVESGAVWVACKAEKGKKRMTVKEFAETHKTGRYIVDMASHNAAVVDGFILDTWNCGEKAVVGYYDMANFDITK